MNKSLDSIIVIPCYNEDKTLLSVIKSINQCAPGIKIAVVNDGSNDETFEVAFRANVEVISHPYNMGNGAAIKTALRTLTADKILIIDADGQHPASAIPELLNLSHSYDLVVGARTSGKAIYSRKFANWIFCKLASYLSGVNIPDLTSGLRIIDRKKALEFIHLYPNGFSFPTTSTLAFISAGYSVKFHPIRVELRPKESKSKIKPLRDGILFLLMIVRISTMINSLRVFVPVSLMSVVAGILWVVRTLINSGQVSAAGAFLIGTGLNILFFGIVVDQLSAIRLKGKN